MIFFKGVYSISKITYFFLSNYLQYLFHRDYTTFIINLTTSLQKNSVLYVKLFQAICMHYHLIDENTNQILIQYTDNSPYNSDVDYKTLLKVINKFSLETNDNIPVPINSGMISTVFKLYSKPLNKYVAIKIKRINIHDNLDKSIQELLSILFILDFIPLFRNLKIYDISIKNIELIVKQLDFKQEVINTINMKRNMANIDYVYVPHVYDAVTQQFDNVIMLEFIDGYNIRNIPKEDYLHYAECVIKYGLVSTLIHGLSHGDLHPGNIIFQKIVDNDNLPFFRIVIIDLGIIYEIDSHVRNAFFEFLHKLIYEPNTDITANFVIYSGTLLVPLENINSIPSHEINPIVQHLSKLIKSMRYDHNNIFANIMNFIYNLSSIMNSSNQKYNIRLSDELFKLQLCISMSTGIAFHLCTNNSFPTFAENCVKKLFHFDILQ